MSYVEGRNPFFNIEQEPLFTRSGIAVKKVALINTDTNDVVGVVSPGYEVVTNKQVADLFDEAFQGMRIKNIEDHLDATTKRWKRMIQLDMSEYTFDITGRDDITQIRVEIFNGYDARTAYGFDISAYRLVCSNGMVAKDRDLLSERFVHFSNNANLLLESFKTKFQNFGSTIDTWKRWAREEYSHEDFNSFVGSIPGITDKMGEYLMDSYNKSLLRYKDPMTKWSAFNGLTYAATHETKARKGSNLFSNRFNFVTKVSNAFYKTDGMPLLLAR